MTQKSHQDIADKNQSVWQLAVIQLSGWTSLPILATSVLVMKESGFYGAIFTIIVGNAIAWFIRLGIIAMSHKTRQSTLDISKQYLGKLGGYFIAVLLILSTLAWFIAQTTAASSALTHLLTIKENPSIDQFTQMSVLLGIISTFLCIEGMVLLRKLSTFLFPLLLTSFIIAISVSPFTLPDWTPATISISGLSLVLVTNLGITSDLPTFFRHSKSLHVSITALTVIQLCSLVLALCSLYFGSIITSAFEINDALVLGTGNEILRLALIGFVFMSVICANVANVYSASVGWELGSIAKCLMRLPLMIVKGKVAQELRYTVDNLIVSYTNHKNPVDKEIGHLLYKAENWLFANQFNQALCNIDKAIHFILFVKDIDNYKKLRSFFNGIPTEKNSQSNLFDKNGDWPTLRSNKISVLSCLERVGAITYFR